MKKVGDQLRLWVCWALALICTVFVTSNFTSFNFVRPVNATVTTVSDDTDRDEFFNAIAQMTSQYPISDNALVFFDKDEDLIANSNGDYFVTEQTFADLTKIVPEQLPTARTGSMSTNATPIYALSDLADQTGFNVNGGMQNIILTRRFGTKRLIIKSTTTDLDLCGAVSSISFGNLHVHQYATESATNDAYNYYLGCQDVQSVSIDKLCWVEDEVVAEPDEIMTLGLGDSFSYTTWGAEAMGVPAYSEYLTNAVNNNLDDLTEIVVAVLDTGIDTDHPWFKNRMLVGDDGKCIGADFSGKVSSTAYEFEDDHGHGTHCAGIICDMTLPNVKVLPIKFMYMNDEGNGVGSTLAALGGVTYAISLKEKYNIVAINMSFGSEVDEGVDPLVEAIQNLYDAGILSVVAAGNDQADAGNYSPANIDLAITVSALWNINSIPVFAFFFSNYGQCVDVSAPGAFISSANNTCTNGDTVFMSGTSMAAPHIAAYIALLYSDPNRHYDLAYIEQIMAGVYPEYIKTTSDPLSGSNLYFGHGMPILTNLAQAPDIVEPDEPEDENTRTYTVKHYWEPIYDLNGVVPALDQYELHQTEYLRGTVDTLTQAVAKNYTGFTAKKFEQKTIGDDTEVKIYYQRNIYSIQINQIDNGFTNITGNGEYLFGAPVTLTPTLATGYNWSNWSIAQCTDENFIRLFDVNTMEPTFTMPACNLIFTAHASRKTYLITVTVVGNGKVTPDSTYVTYGETAKFELIPDYGYHVIAITVDNVPLDDVEGLTRYQLKNVTAEHTIKVEFGTTKVSYKVEHYWEPIYSLNGDAPESNAYQLHEAETMYAMVGEETQAVAKDYVGFTAMAFDQTTIDSDTVVKIYYKRNQYTVSVKMAATYEFANITGAGKYVFGAPVNLVPTLRSGYEFYAWAVDCDDDDFIQEFDRNTMEPSFSMPAANLTFTAYASRKIFMVTIKVVGDGVANPENVVVNYGESVTFDFIPDDGYHIKAVYRDGTMMNFIETANRIYTVTVYTVIANTELTVVFEKDAVSDLTFMDIVIWGGGGLLTVILFTGSTVMLILAFRKPKTLTTATAKTQDNHKKQTESSTKKSSTKTD